MFSKAIIKIVVCALTLVLLCCGCFTTLPTGSTNNTEKAPLLPNNKSAFIEEEVISLKKVGAIPMVSSDIPQNPEIIFGSSLLFSRRTQGVTEYYLYDMNIDAFPKYVAAVDLLYVGSGSQVLTENNKLWFAHDTQTSLNQMNTYMLDIEQGKCAIIDQQENFPPFKFFYKVDDQRLVTYRPEQIKSGEAYVYHIELLDTATGKTKSLLQLNTEQGKHMPCAYYANNKIYTVQNFTNEEETHICTYDLTGKMLQDYTLPMPYGKSITPMLVKDNYVFLDTLDNELYAFQLTEDGKATQVDFPIEKHGYNVKFIGTDAKIADQEVILYNPGDQSFITYNSRSNRFHRYVVDVEKSSDPEQESIYLCVSQEGNLYFITNTNSAVANTVTENEIFVPVL